MKNILFISHSSSLTGAPLLLHDISELLDRSKFRTHFILPEEGPLATRFRRLGETYIEPLYPDEMKYWREIKRYNKRIKMLRKIRPDLVYCNTIHTAKWLAYAKLLSIPTVMHVHELSGGFAALGPVEHFIVAHLTERIIAVSDAVKEYLSGVQGLAAEKIQVIRAGVRPERFGDIRAGKELRKKLGLENALVVGTVGRITESKGSDIFLQLASMLRKAMPSSRIKFLVVGTMEDRDFVRKFGSLLIEYRLQEDVIVLDALDDVSAYFSAMDVYVSTAREDPFPLVVMEAMASGRPVVAFAVGGIPEAVTQACGILINGMDTEAMKEACAGLLQNPRKRLEMGGCARRRIEQNFDIRSNMPLFEHLIDSAIAT